MDAVVTHPPGTTYFVVTIPPDCSEADKHLLRQGIRDAIKDAHREMETITLWEERTIAPFTGRVGIPQSGG